MYAHFGNFGVSAAKVQLFILSLSRSHISPFSFVSFYCPSFFPPRSISLHLHWLYITLTTAFFSPVCLISHLHYCVSLSLFSTEHILYLLSTGGAHMTELSSEFGSYLDRQEMRLEIKIIWAYTYKVERDNTHL